MRLKLPKLVSLIIETMKTFQYILSILIIPVNISPIVQKEILTPIITAGGEYDENVAPNSFRDSLKEYEEWKTFINKSICIKSRKLWNKEQHSLEGNKRNMMKFSWWNDKDSAK